ncbi:TPA: ABC-F family ATP-binding cassette domain-containing protein [Proteus mirabilis]|uniref:ABC-F family ATP-binding cassette domain-containing protein n=1 Tax=Proteus mirabilis TaxID=584 RepID=UPI0005379DD5|nr:ATP-binding cassette domain-containing protein [Proteus mirabilis]AUU39245.1 ABC transporter ATP-binding protein [Proteus mirabilis]EKV7293437.1 ABC-F family ATP-binding cassette domain-containing protein [Proteus mirabilis]EKX9514963.1 ABC-F family ATP-binding cassette domain-containing protein [Proteus mirabilis]ELT1802302.1 ABC-F family ATP-binding cassette domain-containing protein [Proteus mirabilis]MBG5960658.1 ABC-F family ATP-binding cassette domain-containing protein [Proteus mirab
MSTLLSTQNLSFHNNHGILLSNISLALTKGEKIGLIGYNGCGKSTLLKLLSHQLIPTDGSITIANQVIMAYVEQQLPSELQSMRLIDAVLHKLPEELRISESWRSELLLSEMGFKANEINLLVSQLSGGQHTRLLLARALILQPDLLLLDEPSNHLDLPTILWLETFLTQWRGSFILVSHDNRLLDKVTNCTWIIRDKTLSVFRLPCSQARQEQEAQDISAQHRCDAQQKEIDRIAQSAKQLAIWGKVYDNESLSRKAKQMEKQIVRLKDEQVDVTEGNQWTLQLSGTILRADRLLELHQLSVIPAPDAPILYTIDNQRIKSGDRVAIVGANGTGKSSSLKMIWSSFHGSTTSTENMIRLHPRVELGYYDQSLAQLNDNDTLADALKPFAPLLDEQRKMALINAGFVYSRHNQQVKSLSGGERARLLFIGLSLAKYSLLMLDEPTNHLDMEGKQALAEQIQRFSGGILLVSHDRELIEKSCNRFWYIHNGILSEHHDIETIYQLISQQDMSSVSNEQNGHHAPSVEIVKHHNEDELLMKLIALEDKLNADLARKSAHQKPILQAQWQAEIEILKQQLDLA